MKRKRVLLLLCILSCTLQLFAQQINVQGVVYDPSGETVPGANVSMKSNPAVGTVTDIDGNFSLKASVGDVLVFTFIGYEPIEYKLTAADTNLKVRFTDSSELLDEVVVVGYGVQKKSVLSSAVSRVTSEELDKGNPTNIQNALKGKVSGVQIISNSGQPGAESKIRIRGTGTVNNSDPLYIVDGMPSESGISHLNPSDIESIEVLKDAASAAIYGARGANGVVLITTKKGTKGKATLNYEFTYGIQNPSKKVDLLGSADYQMLMNEMAANAGKDPYFPTVSSVNTDWQKELQNKNAPIMNHKVSLSGGTDNSTYYASFGYVKQEGIYAKGHADYERYNVRLNYNNVLLDTKSRNWLNKISFGAIASYSKSIQTGNTIGNSEAAGLITSMNMLPPTEPVYQTDPAILEQYAVTYPNHVIAPNGLAYNIIEMREITNPLAAMQVSHNQRTMPQNFGANFNLDVDLLPGLKFKTTYGAEWVFNSIKNVTPVYELNATSKNATSKVEDKKRESSYWQWENVLSYTKSFGRHNIGALFGTSMSSYHYSNLEAEDYNLLVVDIDKGYIDTATAPEEQSKVWGGAEDHRIASVFGRINYNYDERYMAEVNLRYDGASRFPSNQRWAFFPSFSVGWNIASEPFWESLNEAGFEYLKLRGSYGKLGSQNTTSFYPYYQKMEAKNASLVLGGQQAVSLPMYNPYSVSLTWEKIENMGAALEWGFFKNRFTGTLEWFQRSTKDMVGPSKSLPSIYGASAPKTNNAELRNRGWEFEIGWRDQVNKNFGYGISATFSDYQTEITRYDSPDGKLDGWYSGKKYGDIWGYETIGIAKSDKEMTDYLALHDQSSIGSKWGGGDIMYKDLNNDGRVDKGSETVNDYGDLKVIGNGTPRFAYSFTLDARYKFIDFRAFFQGIGKRDVFFKDSATFFGMVGAWQRSLYTNHLDYFRYAGETLGANMDDPYYGRIRTDRNNSQVCDRFMQNAAYLRLKNLQIGFNLPEYTKLSKYVKRARLYVSGENLFTITKLKIYDPEAVGKTDSAYGPGKTYPMYRVWSIGLDVTF